MIGSIFPVRHKELLKRRPGEASLGSLGGAAAGVFVKRLVECRSGEAWQRGLFL
jgi:hypothetical protein